MIMYPEMTSDLKADLWSVGTVVFELLQVCAARGKCATELSRTLIFNADGVVHSDCALIGLGLISRGVSLVCEAMANL